MIALLLSATNSAYISEGSNRRLKDCEAVALKHQPAAAEKLQPPSPSRPEKVSQGEFIKSQMKQNEKENTKIEEITLEVEELEEVIAPGRGLNHNETLVCDGEEVELGAEELEEVIAPGISVNHNETLVCDRNK